jgi:hypothetical protein
MHVRVVVCKVAARAGTAAALGARALTQHFLHVCATQVALQICSNSSSSLPNTVKTNRLIDSTHLRRESSCGLVGVLPRPEHTCHLALSTCHRGYHTHPYRTPSPSSVLYG